MKDEKSFGIWMDTHEATIVAQTETGEAAKPVIVAHVHGEEVAPNSNEKNEQNQEKMLRAKFFKEIAAHLTNATKVHITGTGVAQEQFMHYLADTAAFKNTATEESTSNKMSDESLLDYFSGKLN